MPPNPERQAKMAAKRAAFDADPEMQQMSRDVGEKVLQGYKNPEVEAVKPRQMLPNFYERGGKVSKSSKDYRSSKVISCRNC